MSVRVAALPRPRALGLSWSDGAALLAVLLWGLNFPITKQVMATTDVQAVTFLRALLSGLIYLVLLAFSAGPRLPRARDLGRIALVGLGGMTLNAVLYAQGLHLTSASHSGLIFTLTPLFVYGVSHLLGYLRLRRHDLLGLGLGMGGAALIIGAPLLAGQEGGASVLGDALTAGAAVTWGAWMLLVAPLLRRYGTLQATAWISLVGAAGLLPPALPGLLAMHWSALPVSTLAGLAYSATLAGAGGGLLWYGAVRRLGPARTMVYANLEAFFVVLFAALLLGERVEWTALAGGLAVIAGVLLTRRAGGEKATA